MSQQSDIADILGRISAAPMRGTSGRSRVGEVLTHFSQAGLTIRVCADARHLGRAISTLKKYARRLNLKFPDYCPRHMKPKKAKKARAVKVDAPKRRGGSDVAP